MCAVTVMQLVAEVSVNGADKAKRDLQDVGTTASSTGGLFKSALGGAFSLAAGVAGDALHVLKDQFVDSIRVAMDHQQVMSQTSAAIKSTGDASGMSADSIQKLAESLSGVTSFSEDTIQSGENLMLTFTGIGKDVFPATTQTMLDMAQAMHQGPTQAAMMLGKALNDPTTGLSALTRVGVTFSDQEKKQIQTMMAHNDVVGAQKVMLHELSTEFGGSAQAAGKTFGGALDILKNKLEDVKIKVGTAVLPILANLMNMVSSSVLPALQKFGDWFSNNAVPVLQRFGTTLDKAFHSPAVQTFIGTIKDLAQNIGGLISKDLGKWFDLLGGGAKQAGGNILSMMPGVNLIQVLIKHSQELAQWWQTSVIPAFKQAEPGFKNLGQALAGLLPVIVHIAGVLHDSMQHAFEAMLPVMEKAIPIIIKIAGIVADGLGAAIKFLTPYIMQAVDAIGKFAGEIVDRVAPIITQWFTNLNNDIDGFMTVWKFVWPFVSQILKGVWDEIMGIVKIAWAIVAGIIKIGLDLLSGNWKQAWTDFKDMLSGIWEGIKTYLNGAWEIIKGIFGGAFSFIVNAVINFKNGVMGHFNDIKNSAGAIFHDLINGIIDHLNDGISAVEGFVNGFSNAVDMVSEKLGAGDIIATVHIPRIPHYASGTDNHPGGPALVGEHGPEIAVLPKGTSVLPAGQTQALLKAFGIPGYAGGVGDALGDFFSWLGSGAKSLLDNVLGALHIGAPSLPGVLNDMSSGIFSKVKDVAVKWIGDHMPHIDFGGGSGGSPVNIPGNLQAWISAAMAATGVPGNWGGALATIAMNESGGDPNAQNNWDINAANGDPSRGLFQTIGATFNAYAMAGHGNILNPIDNAIAAINYIKARYGSVFSVPGIMSLASGGGYVGYANGTNYNPIAGDYLVGERGPEIMHIPRGASVIPNDQVGSYSSSRDILARLDRIASLLERGMSLDGQRVSSALMPYVASQIRYAVGTHSM